MIRTLGPGEAVPTTPPRRYKTAQGYVKLRWKVGHGRYVEITEHRVVNGYVTKAHQVHHINGNRSDNTPTNLRLCGTGAEHGAEHRRIDHDEVIRLYKSGMSTPCIGRRLGVCGSTAFRIVAAAGVEIRTTRLVDQDKLRELHLRGLLAREIAEELGVAVATVNTWRSRLGLRGRPGRPKKTHS